MVAVIICAWCKKKASDDSEKTWRTITRNDLKEEKKGNASHGICPDCSKEHYPEYQDDQENQDS